MGVASFQLLPLWVTLLAIASLLNIHIIYDQNWYAEKRIVQIIIVSTVTLSIVISSQVRSRIIELLSTFSLLQKKAILAFFCIGAFSSLLSMYPSFAFLEMSHFFLLFILSVFIASARKVLSHNIDKLFISSFVACAVGYLVSFLASLSSAIILDSTGINYLDLVSGVLNRRYLNQFQSLSFPILLIAPILLTNKKPIRFLLIFIAAFWFMMMLFTDGRGVTVATIGGILLGGILLPKERATFWRYSLLTIGIGMTLYISLNYLLSFYTISGNPTGDILRQSTGGRLLIWEGTIQIIKESPFLGIGPMHYAFQNMISSPVAHPHNITLQLMSEWGIPATIIITGLFMSALWKWVKQQREVIKPQSSVLSLGLTSAFIAALIHGQLSGVFVMPLSQLAFVLISGWMLGIYSQNKGHTAPTSPVKHNIAKTLLLSFSLLALSTSYYVSLPQFKLFLSHTTSSAEYLKGKDPEIKEFKVTNSAPRFWNETVLEKGDATSTSTTLN